MSKALALVVLLGVSSAFASDELADFGLARAPASALEPPDSAWVDREKGVYAVETSNIVLYDCDALFVKQASGDKSRPCVVVMSGNFRGVEGDMRPIVVFGTRKLLEPVLSGEWSGSKRFQFEVTAHDLAHVYAQYPKKRRKALSKALRPYTTLGGRAVAARAL
jgi:hypothetical protein